VPVGDKHPEVLDQKLIDAITEGPLSGIEVDKKQARAAALAFLYLYLILTHGGERYAWLQYRGIRLSHFLSHRSPLNFSARSALPVGAGLGSSASFSTCAATALLLLSRRTILPPPPAPTSIATGHIHVSHNGRRAIPPIIAEEVNRWAFLAEKILHGNPSGVDNSVAVFGGALAYTRAGFQRKGGMEPIQG